MKYSVIMCNYNYGRFIKKAIDSVLNQTYENFELIIVDDGSEDESREVISSFTDKRIKTIFQENGGQAAAFNSGYEATSGELIALIDSDDWWEPNKLEVVYDYSKLNNDDVALYQHLVDNDFKGKRSPYKNIIPSGHVWKEITETKKIDFFIPTSGFVIPRWVCEKVFPIPLDFWYSADGFLMRTTVIYGKMLGIPEVLAYHRMHEASFTSTVLQDKAEYGFGLLVPQLNKYYKEKGIDFQLKVYTKSIARTKKNQLKTAIKNVFTLIFKW